MPYTKTAWNNGMSPALDADNLNKMEQGIFDATDAIENIDLTPYAPKASPALTGTPTAPTAVAGTNTTQIASTEFVKTAVDAAGAVGEVAFFAWNYAPDGWLKANGAAVSRTTYAALFSRCGTLFGVGDGSTTFNLPDMRGYFPRGWDDGRGVDTGRAFGSIQADDNKSHDHQYGLGYTNSSSMWHTTYSAALAAGDSNVFTTSGYTGIKPSGGTEARPKNISLLACIKY